MTTKFYLKPDAQPRFCRARPVPYALREKIEQEIDRQVEAGVIGVQQNSYLSVSEQYEP